MSPENLRLFFYTGCFVGVVTIVAIFLALLVRYAAFFAVLGAVGVIASLTMIPKSMASQISGYVLASGVGLFLLLVFVYEFVQWRRHQRMLSIRSSFWSQGWRSGRAAAERRAREISLATQANTKRKLKRKPVSSRYR